MNRSRDTEPAPAFHELIHAPVRLRICGLLRPVDELEFAVLRDTLQLKDANLSKNLSQLAEAGLSAPARSSPPHGTMPAGSPGSRSPPRATPRSPPTWPPCARSPRATRRCRAETSEDRAHDIAACHG